jgi:hypothetical protein
MDRSDMRSRPGSGEPPFELARDTRGPAVRDAKRRGRRPAGVTLYVAASDSIPEVNREPGPGMAGLVFVGVALLLRLKAAFHT